MVTDYPFFPPNTIVFIGPNINPDPKFNPNYFFDAKNTGLTISAMIAMSVESNNVIVHYIFFDDSVPNIEVHIKNAIFNTVYGKYTCANKHMINTVKIEQPVMDALGPQRQYVFLDNGFFKMDEYYWGPRTRNIQEINYTVQWYFSQEALRDLPIDTEEFRADKPIDVFVNEIRDMFKRKVDGEWVPELEGVCRFAPMYLYQFSGMKEQTEKVKKTERNYMVITENTVPRKIWSIVKFYFHKTREGVLDYLEVDYFCTREFTSGAGKLTISLLKDFCRLYGISEIVLYSDETAERFYKKEGFKEVGFCVPGGGDFFEDDALPKYSLQIAPKQPHHRTVAITNEESPKTKRVKKGGGRTRTQPTRRRMQKSKKHRKPVRRAVSAKIFSAVKIGKVR